MPSGLSIDLSMLAQTRNSRQFLAAWVADDNERRPHSALGYLTPATYAANFTATNDPLHNTDQLCRSPVASPALYSGTSAETLAAAGFILSARSPTVDPQTVRELAGAAAGESVVVRLGGKTDAAAGGGPLALAGTLLCHSEGPYVGDGTMVAGRRGEWGPTVVLGVGSIEILVVSFPQQMLDLQQFRTFGIDPAARRVVVLKSMQHFRAAFDPIAGKVIVCDSGALCMPDLAKLPCMKTRTPIFPLDDI